MATSLYNIEGRLIRGDYLTDIDLTALIKIMIINVDLDKF